MGPKSRRQRRRTERRPQQIDTAEEGFRVPVQTSNEDSIPEGVDVGATLVHEFGKVGVQVGGVEGVASGRVVFADGEGVEGTVEVLHVGDVAADADDGGGVELSETFNVCEAREGTI